MPPIVSVKVWGEFALFSRPELSVERISYPLMTPSAARGVLDAILFKPQMAWHVKRITVLRPQFPDGFPAGTTEQPYRLVGIRRNEIQGMIAPRTVEGWIKDPESFQPYLVDSAGREGAQGQNRTQRNSLVLQHIAYRIDAVPKLTDRANKPRTRPEDDEDHGPDSVTKYVAMFQRRVAKGQCFHRPYLGIREFVAHFAQPDGTETPIPWTESLGFMLYDLRYDADGTKLPGFFDAKVTNGVLHCDTDGPGPNGEPPVTVHGWDVVEVRT
ncbi:MAG TPA: CRISPR-associated protein Cas5 [Fimbriiglobus sp.]|jgi:CRISPR-associated protein Cas5d